MYRQRLTASPLSTFN